MNHHARHRARRTARALIAGAAGVLVAAALPVAAPATAHPGHGGYSVLVFSKTAGFRHGSIPAAVDAVAQLGAEHDFEVTATEDAGAFTDANLAQYDAVVWLLTTGDVLDGAQQAAFERYIQAGGGYVGVHSASDTEYGWPWYGDLVGAYFASHPAEQTATVKVEDPAHPSTAGLDPQWTRFDEWYNFQTNPRGEVHVLASVDESSYDPGGGAMGVEHPISWCHDYDGGRAWYTGMGHTAASYGEPAFLAHLLGGIETAAGATGADCAASLPGSFATVTLDDTTSNPMDLAVAGDGRVFYIDRGGAVRIVRADGTVTTAGTVPVYTGQEFGLLGIALDPGFATTGWLYLYYSPAGSDPVDRVSRFTVTGDSLDLASEQVLLEIDTQRTECCHAGGALSLDPGGDLYIATGDNTNPFASDGYTPIDERPGRAYWDAQRSSANSAVLNGKILRIHPEPGGSYTIPGGNLFAPGTPGTRPEIYAMGFRNPFTIGVDPATGVLLVADYGPDAGAASPTRGPDGRVEWNIVDQPGFYGWPYCVGDNTPYVDYDFATGASGAAFDCAGGPVNDSPNNTGITQLPATIPAELWMGKSSTGVPEVGPSAAPMTSGVYRSGADPDRAWPAYFDGKAILADWNDGRLFSVQLDQSGGGVVDVSRIFPDAPFLRPMALKWGPDGALYVIDWGSGFGGNNADSGVYRVDYLRGGNRPPAASLSADPASGPVPLQVAFSATGSSDPDGTPVGYQWDFDGDGTTDSTAETTTFTYTVAGDYTAVLTVTDADGGTDVATVDITAGNTAPSITVHAPIHGGFFDWGDTIPYEITVTDPEDGSTQDGGIDCADVVTQPALGHDEHAHPYQQHFGCEGAFPLSGDEGHVGANLFGVVTVTYTDQGAPGVSPLTSQEVVVLQPKHKEAEYFTGTGQVPDGAGTDGPGVQTENTTDQGGGQNIGWISDGDWFGFMPMSLAGIDAVNFRVASGADGGRVEIHVDDPQGPLAGTAVVGGTGGWQSWTTVTAELNDVPAGSSLYFVIRRPAGSGSTSGLLNVNWMELAGPGVGGDPGEPALSPNVHLFYYPWYGSPDIFGSWRHWQQGGHTPPEDIGADLYPALGPYDSGDPAAVDQHMSWVSQSGAGVIVYSWWGQGSYEDSLVPVVLDAAAAHGVTVAWHIEPYPGRTATSVVSDINYINAEYGDHPAYFRAPDQGDRPAFYIFHSLSVPDPDWAVLDQVTGDNIVLAQTTDTSRIDHFSGMYTYDAIAGATAPGWAQAGQYAKDHDLIWAPSVGPGYLDDRAVPGSSTPTLERDDGATYDLEWSNALGEATGGLPTWVSVTSFNEWHEGSQIEPASSDPPAGHVYQTYDGAYGTTGAAAEIAYLERTRHWVTEYERLRGEPPGSGGLSLSPVALGFGLQDVGTVSGPEPVVVTNDGSVPLSIQEIGVSGDFAQSHDCGVSLGVGASCTVEVMFAPTAAGERTGTLRVASDAPGSPDTVALSGTGVDPAGNLALGQPVSASSALAGYPAMNAVDGDAGSYWESTNQAFPQSLTVDLGQARDVARVVLMLPPDPAWQARTQTLSVSGSTDGSAYDPVVGSQGYVFDPATGNTVTIDLPAGAELRYLRVTVTGNTGWPAAQLSELEIYAA